MLKIVECGFTIKHKKEMVSILINEDTDNSDKLYKLKLSILKYKSNDLSYMMKKSMEENGGDNVMMKQFKIMDEKIKKTSDCMDEMKGQMKVIDQILEKLKIDMKREMESNMSRSIKIINSYNILLKEIIEVVRNKKISKLDKLNLMILSICYFDL